MNGDETSVNWGPLIDLVPQFQSLDEFEELERAYKLRVAEKVTELAKACQSGEEPWAQLKAAVRYKENNLIPWQLGDVLIKWGEADPDEAGSALRAIFDSAKEPYEALADFLEVLPKEVVSGAGSRLALGSFLLMGRDPNVYPIYRARVIRSARLLVGWESEAQNEVDEYRDAVEMFDEFRRAAIAAGVEIQDTLEAQGLLYATVKWEPDASWPESLRTEVRNLRRERGMSETVSLKKALEQYDRSKVADRLQLASEQRADFVEKFPVSDWNELPVERYALGFESKDGVSHALEFGTRDCGSISGGSANKHLIYFSKPRDTFAFETKSQSAEEAWSAVRTGVVELIELASKKEFSAIDEIDSLWAGPAVRMKLTWMYFPDQLLPIYSDPHLDFWLSIFNIETPTSDRVAKNRLLFEALTSMEEFNGWQSLEIMHFLYWWTEPNPSQKILKIAPGREAFLWEDCLANGYIRLGWDGTNDLSMYENADELRADYERSIPEDAKGTVTRSVKALLTFRDLEQGDIVVANSGTKKVVGIGRVSGGYRFESAFDTYRHVVDIDWFDTKEREVDFGSAWMFTLVSIKADDYHRIVRSGGTADADDTPIPSVPSLHLEAEKLLDRSGQVIFYGPPGTGKTYAARRHAAWILGGGSSHRQAARAFGAPAQLSEMEAELLRAQVSDARPSWLVVANPSYWSFDELFEKGSEEYDYGRLKRNYEEVAPGDEVFGYEATPKRKIVATATVSRALYTGDTGKQHFDIEAGVRPPKSVSWEMLKEDPVLSSSEPISHGMQGTLFRLESHEAARLRTLAGLADEDGGVATGVPQLTRVTFHPTYSYEDFIEGYKPTESGSGGLELTMRDGVFKRVCRAAAADPDNSYVIMIDEINRGNVPKIFGELITLIEKDKRGMPLTLPQSGESFHVPANVQIIATMNTADRSIHVLDAALRRRFAFVELMPDPGILTEKVGPLPLDGFLAELNGRIRERVGREKQVGHAVLMKQGEPISSASEFALSFKYELLPLLQEYTYGNYKDLAELLGPEVVDEENELPNLEVIEDPQRLVEALAKHLELG